MYTKEKLTTNSRKSPQSFLRGYRSIVKKCKGVPAYGQMLIVHQQQLPLGVFLLVSNLEGHRAYLKYPREKYDVSWVCRDVHENCFF